MKNRDGFTILEILLSITILAFIMIPVIRVFRYSTVTRVKSVNAIHAANLALQKIEEFKFSGRTPQHPLFDLFPNMPPPIRRFMVPNRTEYSRLFSLLIEEKEKMGLDDNWTTYQREEDFGEIPGYPDYKRQLEISFFPMKFPAFSLPPSPFQPNWSINPGLEFAPEEYQKMISRIQILVTVTYRDPISDTEQEISMFTLVSKKN